MVTTNEGRAGLPVVRIDYACDVVRREKEDGAAARRTHLPVEPGGWPFPVMRSSRGERRAGSLNPYQMSSSDFDVAFMTPVLSRCQYIGAGRGREPRGGPRTPEPAVCAPS